MCHLISIADYSTVGHLVATQPSCLFSLLGWELAVKQITQKALLFTHLFTLAVCDIKKKLIRDFNRPFARMQHVSLLQSEEIQIRE